MKKTSEKFVLSGVASVLAIVGFAIIGGVYLEVPAIVIALIAMRRGEGKAARTALLISLGCLVGSAFLSVLPIPR